MKGPISNKAFQFSCVFQGTLFNPCLSLFLSPFSFCVLLFVLPVFQVRPHFFTRFLLKFYYFPFFVLLFPFRVVLLRSMVDYSKIMRTSPSIAFFFVRLGALLNSSSDHLGALLDCSNDHHPRIGDFVLCDSNQGLVLGNLYPLLCQSLAWFKSVHEVLRRKIMGSEVRSSDLETGL